MPSNPVLSNQLMPNAGAMPASWTLLSSVAIYLQGFSPNQSPRKELQVWFESNERTIKQLGLESSTLVSSWSIVVDIAWKTPFNPVRNYVSGNDDLTPPQTLTDNMFQNEGSLGDQIAVVLSTKASLYTQPAIRLANTVKIRGSVNTA
jgi:hypothetical protein